MFRWCLLAVALYTSTGNGLEAQEDDTLVLLHVFARHGDRMPDPITAYPNDLYKDNKYYPVGPGGLTKRGVQRSYEVGARLRRRYNKYLGPTYIYDQIKAISSGYPRCKRTMQALLTKLFPDNELCNAGQIVEFSYIELEKDQLITTYHTCGAVMDPIIVNPEHLCPERNYLNRLLEEYAGYTNPTLLQMLIVQDTIKAQEEVGMDIPKWVEPVWREPLWTCSRDLWRAVADNKTLLSYGSGNLMHKIITDTYRKIRGETPELKTYIYTGHDLNIVALLGILGLYDGQEVKYSEYLMFEVHEIDGIIGFKVYHENYLGAEPVLLDIPNCGTFCPIDTLLDMTYEFVPVNWCQF